MRTGTSNTTVPEAGRNSYMASAGDWPELHVFVARARSGADDIRADAKEYENRLTNPRGAFSPGTLFINEQRVIGHRSGAGRSLGAIGDGTSNTIAVAEKNIGLMWGAANTATRGGQPIKRSFATNQTGAVAGPAGNPANATGWLSPTANGIPNTCFTLARVGSDFAANVQANGEAGGVRWADGLPTYSSFSTILPPNSPSCAADSNGDVFRRVLSSASSDHTGGVNALRFDGSVSFISDTISVSGGGVDSQGRTGLGAFAVREGQSPYGVWGALGSINGGESASL